MPFPTSIPAACGWTTSSPGSSDCNRRAHSFLSFRFRHSFLNSEVELRALRDGAPKNSVRIMGYTFRRTSTSGWKDVPGTSVGISGPAGEIIVTSDQRGLYDISGLPPGWYSVHGMDPKEGPYWAHAICTWDGSQSLKSGDIRECGVTVR